MGESADCREQLGVVVHITEKAKGPKDLTLLNLRDEVVNFLYKDALASSTRTDMQFFVLLYFASIQIGDKSFLEIILDEAIPKFNRLNQAFQHKQGYLRANEYRQMVNEYDLTDIFKNDVFFVLATAILNIDAIEARFADFYSGNQQLARVVNVLKEQYRPTTRICLTKFVLCGRGDPLYLEPLVGGFYCGWTEIREAGGFIYSKGKVMIIESEAAELKLAGHA